MIANSFSKFVWCYTSTSVHLSTCICYQYVIDTHLLCSSIRTYSSLPHWPNDCSEPRALNSNIQPRLPAGELEPVSRETVFVFFFFFQENRAGVEVDAKLFIIPPQQNKEVSKLTSCSGSSRTRGSTCSFPSRLQSSFLPHSSLFPQPLDAFLLSVMLCYIFLSTEIFFGVLLWTPLYVSAFDIFVAFPLRSDFLLFAPGAALLGHTLFWARRDKDSLPSVLAFPCFPSVSPICVPLSCGSHTSPFLLKRALLVSFLSRRSLLPLPLTSFALCTVPLATDVVTQQSLHLQPQIYRLYFLPMSSWQWLSKPRSPPTSCSLGQVWPAHLHVPFIPGCAAGWWGCLLPQLTGFHALCVDIWPFSLPFTFCKGPGEALVSPPWEHHSWLHVLLRCSLELAYLPW